MPLTPANMCSVWTLLREASVHYGQILIHKKEEVNNKNTVSFDKMPPRLDLVQRVEEAFSKAVDNALVWHTASHSVQGSSVSTFDDIGLSLSFPLLSLL